MLNFVTHSAESIQTRPVGAGSHCLASLAFVLSLSAFSGTEGDADAVVDLVSRALVGRPA